MYHSVKTKRTLFTDEKIANLHRNIANHHWAKEKADKILEAANVYLDYGVDTLTTYFAPQEIGRSYWVNQAIGCPNCGKELMRHKTGHWDMDFLAHPWKVKCPNCGNLYPSNDFGAFYKSGLDEHGLFSYDRADRSLLVNTLYPDKPADYAVDDGRGWFLDPSDPFRCRFLFVSYYVAWLMWGTLMWGNYQKDFRSYGGAYAVGTMAEAYLITGDKRYGFAAAQLYLRMAQLYPTLDISPYLWAEGYSYSDGGTGRGRILGSIYDTVVLMQAVEWYDMLFDCIDDEFAAYLRANPVRYLGEPPADGAAVREIIEKDLLLRALPDYQSGVLNCNPGYAQVLLLKTATILEGDDLFEEYADYIYNYIDQERTGQHRYDMDSLFTSEVNRDGFAGEVAAHYNCGWVGNFVDVAQFLRGSKYDLFRHPKFKKLGEMLAKYVCADRYTLPIGDHSCCGMPGIMTHRGQLTYFLEYGREEDAIMLAETAGDGPICTDWYRDCAAIDRTIREAAAGKTFRSKSRCLSEYGLAAIESHPEGKDPESNALWFGKNWGHSHKDTMNLHLHGFGIDLMPDFGTPGFKDYNAVRFRWEANMLSHNTAMLPQTKPLEGEEDGWYYYRNNIGTIHGAQIRHFLAGDQVSLIDAEAPKLYDTEYRRTVVTVDLDGKSRYLVDLFNVGGENQRLSYHAAGTQTTETGITFVPQDGGTYAGVDVAYADEAYDRDRCDGFNYLTDVRSAKIDGGCTVDWKCVDNWHVWDRERDVHVKLHLLSGAQEAALCTGFPPQTRKESPREMKYLILKNGTGATRFVNVLEPYEDTAFIERCAYQTDGNTAIVTVTHKNGRVDTVTVTREGTGCRLTVKSTTGFAMSYGDTVLTGEVVDFTRELGFENFVTVRLDGDGNADALAGKFVDIETDVEPNAFYEIKGAESLGGGLWKLGTGDCTFVARYIDRMDKDKGYLYFIETGAKVRITM